MFNEILVCISSPTNWRNLLLFVCFLMVGCRRCCMGARCNVDTTIETFREDVPAGTVVLKIPFHEEEAWEFRDNYPEGYLEMETLESGAKIITFKRSPDLEEININHSQNSIIESLEYTLSCMNKGIRHLYKQRIALVDINENDPYFSQSEYSIQVNEMALVGTAVFSLVDKAADDDVTGTISLFRLHPFTDKKVDGRNKFSLSTLGQEIVLKESLDHDAMEEPQYFLNISVQDNGYPVSRISFATLVIDVLDADDQGPAFVYPNCPKVNNFCATPAYTARVAENSTGLLKILPGQINAEDRDQQKNNIFYTILHAEPQMFWTNFLMDNKTGHIRQKVRIIGPQIIRLVIKAEEISKNRRFITSTLIIRVAEIEKGNFEKTEDTLDSIFAESNETKHVSHSDWPISMVWAGGSVSVTVFFIVIGGLLLILMGMTLAIFFAFRDRKHGRQNVTFDDSSSNSAGSSSFASRDTVSTSDVSTATPDPDIDGSTIEDECNESPVTLEFADENNQQVFDPTSSRLPVLSSSPKCCKEEATEGHATFQKKKKRKSSKLSNLLTYSNRKATKKDAKGRFNFAIENHWLDMPYGFD